MTGRFIDRPIGPPDDARVVYGYDLPRYGSRQRWLIKALREVAHQVEGLVVDLSERQLRWRPPDGDWCAKEVVAFLRDSEREDLRAVQATVARDGARIEERRAQHGPAEHDYRSEEVAELLWDFATMREEMVWTLRTAGEGWEHKALHPYRGAVPLESWVREINERDLEAMWTLRRLRDAVRAPDARL